MLAKGTPGEVYNIGGSCERTNLEVVRAICATVDRLRPGLPHARARRWLPLSRTGLGTIADTRSTPRKSAASWAGSRSRITLDDGLGAKRRHLPSGGSLFWYDTVQVFLKD